MARSKGGSKRKFAQIKKVINKEKERVKEFIAKSKPKPKFQDKAINEIVERVKDVPIASSAMYLRYNTALGPPYHVLMDTNFINFSMQNKLDIYKSMLDCLFAKVIPTVCSCVIAELEKLGHKFRLALRMARDPRFKRLVCENTYADDCIVARVTAHPIWIVATCDKELKRRIRRVPGVPIMYISGRKYTVERMPDAFMAPR